MSYLDQLFEKCVQEKLRLLEQECLEFRTSHAHWTEQKTYREILLRLRKERNEMTESKWKNGGDLYLSASLSEYKTALFSWFQRRNDDYQVKPVHHFMQEDYPKLQQNFLIKFSLVPDNSEVTKLQLSEFFSSKEEVTEQLAYYEAILKFILKLEVEESDILFKQRYLKTLESVKLSETAELTFPDDVLDLITKGNDVEAAKRLSSYLKENEFPADLIKEATQIQALLANAERDFHHQKITLEQKNVQFSKTREAMLALVKRVQEKQNP